MDGLVKLFQRACLPSPPFMKKAHHFIKTAILQLVDSFYPLFKRFMPLQTFRYAACGGGNTVLGFILYTLSYKLIFKDESFDLGFYVIKSHNASLILAFLVNFPVGFFLMKYVVFVDSSIRGHIQLLRYFFVFVSNLFLNYLLLDSLVVRLGVNAILAQVISTVIVIVISYLLQRHFTFKVKAKE